MAATTQEFLHSTRYSRDSFSSMASRSSGSDLPYVNSCLEYGLDLIEQALIEQDPDSPRSSVSPTTLRSYERDYDDDEANWLQREEVTITLTGAEVGGSGDLWRESGARDSTQSSAWQEDGAEQGRWRRGTVFLDEEEDQTASLDDGRHGRRRITISTDHSSEIDMGPLTPPANLHGLEESDSGEVWLGRDGRAPSWAGSDIVGQYRTGWLDDQRKQQSRPESGGARARASTSTDSFRGSVQRRQVSEWRDEEDGDVRGEVDDFSMDRLHVSSSGRSVMPGNRLLLNTRSQDGHHHPDNTSLPAARPRPGSGSDSAWRDSGIWSPGLAQSKSVTSLAAAAKMQSDEGSPTSSAPRLRGMRSLLLTKPITPKRTQSDNPTIPESGALRELAPRGSESAPLTGTGTSSRHFDAPDLPTIPASSPPDVTKQFIPSTQAENEQNRRYHYQKPKRSQSMDREDAAREKEKMVTSGWEDERERATLKKEKKPTPVPVAKATSVTKVKPVKSASVGPPKSTWVSSGLAMHGLTYNPNTDYMPRRPATAGPPPDTKSKGKSKAEIKPKADSKDQGDSKSVTSADSKSLADNDTKSTKERKKGRMGSFVVKVLSNKGSKPPPMPPPPTPSTPVISDQASAVTDDSASSKSKPSLKKEKGKKEAKPIMPVSMVMAYM